MNTYGEKEMIKSKLFKWSMLSVGVLVCLLLFLLLLNPLGTVRPGERGVLLRFNAVTGKVYNEGLYIVIPFVEKVIRMDVKIQKEQVNAGAASKDLQDVHSIVALNYNINPNKVAKIYQEIGINYRERIIDPALQETVKAVTAMFTAEELITKRAIIREDIKSLLKKRLTVYGIEVDEFNIVNFNFSKSFNEAIEAKVTAEQDALAAKNKLEQVKYEAQQKVAEAEGKAKAITIEAAALRSNPQVLELRALEKWNGILPQVTGGAVPFISIKKE